ncbi:hypothetical protein A2U01_0042741, partial [Trifolium medium]|nr:hypothetical protein [Trifolium medium]
WARQQKERWLASPPTGMVTAFGLLHTSVKAVHLFEQISSLSGLFILSKDHDLHLCFWTSMLRTKWSPTSETSPFLHPLKKLITGQFHSAASLE